MLNLTWDLYPTEVLFIIVAFRHMMVLVSLESNPDIFIALLILCILWLFILGDWLANSLIISYDIPIGT